MKVINIVWETDGVSVKELNLPVEVNVPENIDTENIADFLSDEYGYLVKSFEIESDSRKEYCLEMANTIWKSIFQSVEKEVVMSWGVSKHIATWFQNMPALLFCVNGFIHKGSVVITYNEGVDYYEIYFFDKKGQQTREPITDVAFDELGLKLDENIEKPENMSQKEYDNKIKEFFLQLLN